jgi:phosphoglycolate phosphatase
MVAWGMSTVFLFDIDGTLVWTGGAGRRAMTLGFADVHGRTDVFDGLSFGGMTDRAIVRHGLAKLGGDIDGARIDAVLDAYLVRLEGELLSAEYRVFPGVEMVLAELATLRNVAIGLGTGNVRRGAYAKLARGALGDAFAFGGFGCDAEDRAELLRAGVARGAAQLGRTVDECKVVVIGDTPKDVAAALAIGARCIGVGTGAFTRESLMECGAHAAFRTLADEGVREALLSS